MLDRLPVLYDDIDDGPVDHIKTGSFTRLENYEKCAFRAKLLYVDKVPEPERPLPEGKTEQPNERGARVHEAAEAFIRGGVELIPELEPFRVEYTELRRLFALGRVSVEGEWGFDSAWQSVAWMSADVWLRVKLDAMVWLTPKHVLVQDLKTGKRNGNEMKHADQMTLYSLAALMKYPEIDDVSVELWYPDVEDLADMHGSRGHFMRHFKRYNDRFLKMTQERAFAPRPNAYSCKWCRYGPKGSGVCTVGV
jgi:hypothetical protein